MAEQDSRLRAFFDMIRLPFVVPGVVACIAIYGTASLVSGIFSRQLPWFFARLWWTHILWICQIRVSVSGLQRLDPKRQYVFVVNHQSMLDIVAIYRVLPFSIRFMAKRELFEMPFFGWGMKGLRQISIDRSNARNAKRTIDEAIVRIKKENISLVIFPEGTRSITGEIGEFKPGAFSLAIDAGLPLAPVAISGRAIVAGKKVLFRSGKLHLTVGDPIEVTGAGRADRKQIAEQVREVMIRNKHRHD